MDEELATLFYPAMATFAASENLQLEYPNIHFDNKKLGDKEGYIKPDLLPTDPSIIGLCTGAAVYVWVANILIYFRAGINARRSYNIATKLAEAFPVKHDFNSGGDRAFKVITPPSAKAPIPIDAWYILPVDFRVHSVS